MSSLVSLTELLQNKDSIGLPAVVGAGSLLSLALLDGIQMRAEKYKASFGLSGTVFIVISVMLFLPSILLLGFFGLMLDFVI